MRKVFRKSQPLLVPDGTLLSPFLSPLDSESGLPGEVASALSEVSIAEGLLPTATKSRIQFHPHTCLITFVLDGELTVRMQGPRDDYRSPLQLSPGEAGVTERGSYLQLINDSSAECRVLYIVTPAYVFLLEGDVVEQTTRWFSMTAGTPSGNATASRSARALKPREDSGSGRGAQAPPAQYVHLSILPREPKLPTFGYCGAPNGQA